MTHEAHRYCLLVSKVLRLSLSFKLLHFDRIAGRVRPSRIRGESITVIARPEFQPEVLRVQRMTSSVQLIEGFGRWLERQPTSVGT